MENPHIAAEKFAATFRDAEYALKRSKYLRLDKKNAEADWDGLARDLGQNFFKSIVNSGLAKTLIGNPPRQLKADGLEWSPEKTTPLDNVHQLIVQGVCRVRNNYLHGEKFRGGPEGEWERDLVLIEEAHAVLNQALNEISGR